MDMSFNVRIHASNARFEALSKLLDADEAKNANQTGEDDVLQNGLAAFATQNGP